MEDRPEGVAQAPPTGTTGATRWCSSRSSSPTRGPSGSSTACPSASSTPRWSVWSKGCAGKVTMEMDLTIRFGYGQIVPWVRRIDGTLNAIAGPDGLSLWTPVDATGRDLSTVAEFTVSEGQQHPVLARPGSRPTRTPPRPVDAAYAIAGHRAVVDRVGLTVHLRGRVPRGGGPLADHPEGADLRADRRDRGRGRPPRSPRPWAAARNWDYRFCWLRDATLTLESLMRGGFYEEAMAWRNWLLRATAGDPSQMQIMYGAAGERRLDEWEVDWLPGLRGVGARCGSATRPPASSSWTCTARSCRPSTSRRQRDEPGDSPAWELQLALMDFLETDGASPTTGSGRCAGPGATSPTRRSWPGWPSTGPSRRSRSTASKAPVDRWKEIRKEIHDQVCDEGFNPAKGSFTQYYGSDELDASLLMIPLVRLPARPRSAGARDHRGHRARAGRGRLRPPLPDRRHRRGRRADRSGGRLPGLLVLAGRLPLAARAASTTPGSCSTG